MDVIRCVFLGNDGVGKTSLATSFAENRFLENPVPSVHHNKTLHLNSPSDSASTPYLITLMITDTHPAFPPFTLRLPNSRFAAISAEPSYVHRPPLGIPDADVFVICFSVANRASFAAVRDRYIREARRFCKGVPCVVVGTKIDLRAAAGWGGGGGDVQENADEAVITTAQGARMAWEVGAEAYAECSARTGEGVSEVFDKAAYAAVEYQAQAQKRRWEREHEEEREPEPEVEQRRTKGPSPQATLYLIRRGVAAVPPSLLHIATPLTRADCRRLGGDDLDGCQCQSGWLRADKTHPLRLPQNPPACAFPARLLAFDHSMQPDPRVSTRMCMLLSSKLTRGSGGSGVETERSTSGCVPSRYVLPPDSPLARSTPPILVATLPSTMYVSTPQSEKARTWSRARSVQDPRSLSHSDVPNSATFVFAVLSSMREPAQPDDLRGRSVLNKPRNLPTCPLSAQSLQKIRSPAQEPHQYSHASDYAPDQASTARKSVHRVARYA
ncbi:P-loop containing nucleoside triphosphate hydrolase protein [Favolaschia claudopus]|uniref:P-loop containing nucleoside triphosphate hydrolase protein n=1 Tax=Favolaschia claudopus TaxID=2862362 RepID=A0AAW0A134_9AGAR